MLKKLVSLIVFILFPPILLLSVNAEELLPYEKCRWFNKGFTDRIIRETKEDLSSLESGTKCVDCIIDRLMSMIDDTVEVINNAIQQITSQSSHIPDICFLASTLRVVGKANWQPSTQNYYYCSSSHAPKIQPNMMFANCRGSNQKKCALVEPQPVKKKRSKRHRFIHPRRPCLNEAYIKQTAEAFNKTADCFGFTSKKDKNQLFALMNYESSFILNKKATPYGDKRITTARCYGQIKNGIIIDINRYINYPKLQKNSQSLDPQQEAYHNIYKDVINKCPFLKNKTAFMLDLCKRSSTDAYTKCLKRGPSKSALKCRTSQDPYSCLFYTLYNLKIQHINIDNILKAKEPLPRALSTKGFSKKHAKNKKLIEDFTLPLNVNEILVIKGSINIEGKETNVHFLVRDAKEAHDIFNQRRIKYDTENIWIRKVKVFDDNQLKWAFSHLAHNGGGALVRTHFKLFMKQFKECVADSSCSQSRRDYGNYRRSLLKGYSLEGGVISQSFEQYTRNHSVPNKYEVSIFLDRLNSRLNYFSGNGKALRNAVNNLSSKKPLNKEQVKQFLKSVISQCPSSLF